MFSLLPPIERGILRIIVCGDRNWKDEEAIRSVLQTLPPSTTIIEGGARGADRIAKTVAKDLGMSHVPFPAHWHEHYRCHCKNLADYCRAAGVIRNERMLKKGSPDAVLAFHDDLNASKGTKHMVTIALEADVPCFLWIRETGAVVDIAPEYLREEN